MGFPFVQYILAIRIEGFSTKQHVTKQPICVRQYGFATIPVGKQIVHILIDDTGLWDYLPQFGLKLLHPGNSVIYLTLPHETVGKLITTVCIFRRETFEYAFCTSFLPRC